MNTILLIFILIMVIGAIVFVSSGKKLTNIVDIPFQAFVGIIIVLIGIMGFIIVLVMYMITNII